MIRRAAQFIAALLLIGFALASVAAAYIYHYGQADLSAPADVIIVLGGGTLPDGSATLSTARRAIHAAQLYREGLAPAILCSGGYTGGHPASEASACASVAESAGVPSSAVILEERSTSTEENAIESRKIMTARGFKTALLVSDEYHMLRAEWLFHSYGMTVLRSPAPIISDFFGRVRTIEDTYREVAALTWYMFKTLIGLQATSVKFAG